MEENRQILLDEDSKYDVMSDIKKELEHRKKDEEDSTRISHELKPIIDKIYIDAGKPLPWRVVEEK